jgi:hypothetical protein
MSDKVRENRARRAAERQGLMLMKSRRRDPMALDFNTWMLVDGRTGRKVLHRRRAYGVTLDEVEAWLRGEGR